MLPRHALDSRALVYVPHVAAAPVKAHGHGACALRRYEANAAGQRAAAFTTLADEDAEVGRLLEALSEPESRGGQRARGGRLCWWR